MNNWELEIAFHWPHNRLAFGWDYMDINEEYNYKTIRVYLFFITLTLNY
jgi:hypothetical protein